MLLTAAGAAGVVIALAGLAVLGLWYASRPTPPKPWNTTAIVANEPPSFRGSDDGKSIKFSYAVENTTNTDYGIDSDTQIKAMVRYKDGSLNSLGANDSSLELPFFIPAKQKVWLTLSINLSTPKREASETDEQYHERLRDFLNNDARTIDGVTLFDEIKPVSDKSPKVGSQETRSKLTKV